MTFVNYDGRRRGVGYRQHPVFLKFQDGKNVR